jgi:YHS domain-containing protein
MLRSAIRAGLVGLILAGVAVAQDSEEREIPAPFAPFEYMVGSWKGAGQPSANRVKGWTEKHMWAWKFAKGVPVGMSVVLEGNKSIAKGQLTYDAAQKRYVLEGTDPAGKPVSYSGTVDAKGKTLTLDRAGETDSGKERLTLFPNANLVRYTIYVLHQEPGAPQFKRVIDIGVTKEGETFAAGSGGGDAPKCIVTGGAATMTVSYNGKSFPLCCTGCRDEFNDNPEKYLKKAALRLEQGDGKSSAKPVSSSKGKDDGSFDGLVDEPKAAKPRAMPKAADATDAPKKGAGTAAAPKEKEKDAAKSKAASRAASQLQIAQNLEKSGKTAAALTYYKQIVKNYPGTAQAKTAAARIKALGGE